MDADKAIKNRKTAKVLANSPWPISLKQETIYETINELLDLAVNAPFHYTCHEQHTLNNKLNSCVPWRFYVLDSSNSRLLLQYIENKKIKAGKITNMLAAADALFLVTWLPEPHEISVNDSKTSLFNGNLKNMEHIAACSAAIQNVLIGATARNIPNYWSSGGILRKEELSNFIQIPSEEIMLGALFLFPEDSKNREATIKPGALRDKGKEKNTWSRWIDINNFDN